MIIREMKQQDIEQVIELANKYNLNLPAEGTLFVAEAQDGKIVGFVNIRAVFMIEPFVCENSLAANKLWKFVKDKSIEGNVKILRCYAQKKHETLFKRLGFYSIFDDKIPLEINFYKEIKNGR